MNVWNSQALFFVYNFKECKDEIGPKLALTCLIPHIYFQIRYDKVHVNILIDAENH